LPERALQQGPLRALAWARLPRLGEVTLHPKLKPLTWTRVPKESTSGLLEDSPRRAVLAWARCASLKTILGRLGEKLKQNQGEFLLFSPRRNKLAWARISALVVVSCMQNQKSAKHNHTKHSNTSLGTFNPFQAKNRDEIQCMPQRQ